MRIMSRPRSAFWRGCAGAGCSRWPKPIAASGSTTRNWTRSIRAELVIDLVRTLAEHALAVPADSREPIWQEISTTTADFQRQHPQNPRVLLVRMQAALALLARAELARQEAEIGDGASHSTDDVRAAIRAAIVGLKQLDDDLAGEIRRRTRPVGPAAGLLGDAELASIEANVALSTRARISQSGARLSGRQQRSAERLYASHRAARSAGQIARRRSAGVAQPRRGNRLPAASRPIGRGDAPARRTGNEQTAAPLPAPLAGRSDPAAAWPKGDWPKRWRPRAAAVDDDDSGAADLDFARLEVLVALWQRAAGQEPAARRRPKARPPAARRSPSSRPTIGSAWPPSRCSTSKRSTDPTGCGGPKPCWPVRWPPVPPTSRPAQSETSTVRPARRPAIGGPDKSTKPWRCMTRQPDKRPRRARPTKPLSWARPRPASRTSGSNFAMPSGDSTSWPRPCPNIRERPRPIWPPSITRPPPRQPKESRTDKATLAEYRQLLEHHLRTWPQAPSAGQVAWWLGRLYDHDGQWSDAIAAFRRVPPGHAQYAAAVEGAARAYQRLLDRARAAGKPDPRTAGEAVDWLRQIIAESLDKPDQAALGAASDAVGRQAVDERSSGRSGRCRRFAQTGASRLRPMRRPIGKRRPICCWSRRWSSGSATTKRPRCWAK